MEKFSLIDLEAQQWATGRKQAQAVQRERLSEKTSFAGRCDSLNSDITKKVAEFGSKNSNRQKWSVNLKLLDKCKKIKYPIVVFVTIGYFYVHLRQKN